MFVYRGFICLKLSVQLTSDLWYNFTDTKIDKSPVNIIICLINQNYFIRE